MVQCPRCEMQLDAGVVRCSDCGAEVTLLARLAELPDLQFNAALAALRRGDATTAQSMAGALLAARPGDAEGWYLLGHIYALAGHWADARQCWTTMNYLRPSDPRAARALQQLDESFAPRVAVNQSTIASNPA